MLHKQIVTKTLSGLNADRASYFGDIIRRMDDDPRTEEYANLAYTLLKHTIAELPMYLDKALFLNLLFQFIDDEYEKIRNIIFAPEYTRDPDSIRAVTQGFVLRIVTASLDAEEKLTTDEAPSVHKLTWPYRETDVIDPDEEPEAWEDAVKQNARWLQENGGIDRRKSGHARVDEMALGIHDEEIQEKAGETLTKMHDILSKTIGNGGGTA